MADIVLDHVSKRFADGRVVVDDVTLTIADGEFLILVGPSGCGKSTTLNMIAGLEDISAGELRIGGKVVNRLSPRDRDIAMVFQSYALYPHMTVRQNMGFALSLAKLPKIEIARRVEEAARILGLTEHLERRPAALSGGQRQRVAMGRAIVRSPQAFLMDEPLSNLDAKLRVQTRTQISRLQNRLGTTTVYVTHDQTEAMTLGDRVAVMRAGRIQQIAPPGELYAAPVNIFVAGFIGSPAMNFLPVTLTADGRALRTPLGEWRLDGPRPDDGRQLDDGRLVDRLRRAAPPSGERPLVCGIRPEHFEDAALVPADRGGARCTVRAEVVESLGSDKYVYSSWAGPVALGTDLSADLPTDPPLPAGAGTQLVARLDAASRAAEGEPVRLWVDTTRLHLFDPASGANLTAPRV
ncbi:multiple sugar transport system ATP-binding protein [Parafrankia irregularis]|uniref:Multiple sugar transport system ATP-binding protein n=1 Tax=Parafrankia irregularis TaxID=795642 RepID=A0A0S4QV17_9ACTN|nr:sn-glycerol-3-phosphate ABC transporter ATP-binding protein UgpC [Parafrankia irregularis]CUU58278.1 multiple sugar transport system ATP-binding protein [Parafrankia irregularis]